jgi:hypothetical protein
MSATGASSGSTNRWMAGFHEFGRKMALSGQLADNLEVSAANFYMPR